MPPSPMNENATRWAPSRQNAIAMPAIESEPIASGAAAGSTPQLEVAGVQVLAAHRRAGLAHLRA